MPIFLRPGLRPHLRPAPFLRQALAGAAATASGNGLARFAYVPLFPAMVTAGWVDGGQAGLLGAAALLGYLIGSLAGRGAARGLGVRRTLDLGMALVVLALAACAWNGGFAWLLGWRTMAGVAGGLLMALAGPATQASVAPAQRGTAGGVVIAGVGLGIATGALLVPALLPAGLPATWLGWRRWCWGCGDWRGGIGRTWRSAAPRPSRRRAPGCCWRPTGCMPPGWCHR